MISQDNRAIGVFDSGFGGLTIMKRLIKIMPHENFIYFGDGANAPYGDKTKKEIVSLTKKAALFLAEKKIKILVIACNTASVYAYKEVKKELDIPVLEIISPSYTQVFKYTKNNNIGIIATKATIYSKIYRRLILKKRPSCKVHSQACPLLVPLIEKGKVDSKSIYCIAKKYLEPLKRKNIDVLLLACTHYPLIKTIIQKIMGRKIKVLDPSIYIARYIKNFIRDNNLSAEKRKKGFYQFYTSGEKEEFKKIAEHFMKMK